MKWITRARAKVDRVACPWLISRFIDPKPEFIYVSAEQVLAEAQIQGATPYDIPDIELGHHGSECSFDAFMDKYGLKGVDPALDKLALIVRGADTSDKDLTPESRGLDALAGGFQKMEITDHQKLELEFPVYDAFYIFCGGRLPVARSLALATPTTQK
ncbi:MAG TPA: chromate resistance protein ChrB domain-containing protein [Chloroflexia bacterium]|nr:chromate resistance protein ChrB domain-containing protein [Chloroflexia bacterium]